MCTIILSPRSPLCARIRSQRRVKELIRKNKVPAPLQGSSWRSRCSCNGGSSKSWMREPHAKCVFETACVDSHFIPVQAQRTVAHGRRAAASLFLRDIRALAFLPLFRMRLYIGRVTKRRLVPLRRLIAAS